MNPSEIIRTKRDGGELSDADIERFVSGFLDGDVAPYQMTAFLMAVFFSGMTASETATLTRVMVETGDTLDFSDIPGKKLDKHSTGGVGDLISLPLAPLVAACGVPVPMISGRGLGHTGGTLDKLESITGLRTDLDEATFRSVLEDAGFAMGGQTQSLAPADRRMYALRDVTATVESVPLIVSSILSKKVAEGIDALVLDVKCGRGAFMKKDEDALNLAQELTRVGTLMGKHVVAFVTDMDLPLGAAIGNAVEIRSAVDCLRGNGPPDIMELVFTLGTAMLCLHDSGTGWNEGWDRMATAVADGSGFLRFRRMVELQGGNVEEVDDPGTLPQASVDVPVRAPRDGFLVDVDPFALGRAVVELGGGRQKADDIIDPSVGILQMKRYGERVAKDEPLARVLASSPETADKVAVDLGAAYHVETKAPPPRKLIRYLVTADGHRPWEGERSWTGS